VNEHTQAMLEYAAVAVPLLLGCAAGIISLYSRLSKVETKMESERNLTNEQFASRDAAIKLLADDLRHGKES
jgi:hypothetical protein